VLVNNAGFGYNAAVEEAEEQQVRAMFDTNVFGLAAVMWRVLPACGRASAGTFSTSRRSAD
jgi:NAD(P)-dependent dehydrogenase (short-subunit alcohol dehydrogenase family)